MDNPEYFIDEDIPSLSLVWRPLVSKFSRDPELIYWVPPLYLSGDTLRSKKKNTTEILSPASFGRLRPKHLVSGRWSRKPATSSRANLLSASEETLYLGWTPKNPINLEGSEHFYEKTPNIFQMHRNPMNFIGLDNHTKRRDSFSYAHNRYKKLESRPSDASDTVSRDDEHSSSTQTWEKEARPEETEVNERINGVFIIDSSHPKSVFHTTPGKSPGITVVKWPDDLKDIHYSPEGNRPDIQGWTGTHTYMNDTHLLHKMAARSLTPQTPSGADSQIQCDTPNMEESRSNEESSENLSHQENIFIVLNTRLYVISVFMIILVGVFLTTVILQTQEGQP